MSRRANLEEREVEAYIEFLPEIDLILKETDLNEVFRQASEIAFRTKMKTMDGLHISACLEMGAQDLLTFDYEFVERKGILSEMGINIISE